MPARRSLFAAALAAVLSVSGCSGADSKTYRFENATKLGTVIPAPDRKPAGNVSAPMLDGDGTYRLSADAGKVVLLNFWATWCPPCVAETPQLDSVYRDYQDKGVTIVGVDTKNSPRDLARSFVADNDITYPMVYDEQGESIVTIGNIPSSLPFSVLVDRKGRVAAVYLGPVTPKDLAPVFDTLRAER